MMVGLRAAPGRTNYVAGRAFCGSSLAREQPVQFDTASNLTRMA